MKTGQYHYQLDQTHRSDVQRAVQQHQLAQQAQSNRPHKLPAALLTFIQSLFR
jgi:hypothetical protein